jgi:hypothetical protein
MWMRLRTMLLNAAFGDAPLVCARICKFQALIPRVALLAYVAACLWTCARPYNKPTIPNPPESATDCCIFADTGQACSTIHVR